MTEWKARRFWKEATIAPAAGGWQVELDGKPVRTPGKLPLVVPSQSLARAIAAEWDQQADVIDPHAMPLTRAANSAVEKVTPQFDAVADMLAEYGATDLLCYRAAAPEALAARQAAAWDRWLDWARDDLGAPLNVTAGVMAVDQPPETLAALRGQLGALSAWELTGLHDLVTLPGSLILGLAVAAGQLDAAEAHRLARVDEDYQADAWGRDDEAEAANAARALAMADAERFLNLLRQG